jgi:hypothetical protein
VCSVQTTFTAAASKQPAVTAAALWQAQDAVAPGAALCGAAAQFIAKGRRTRSDAFRLLQVMYALSDSCSQMCLASLTRF